MTTDVIVIVCLAGLIVLLHWSGIRDALGWRPLFSDWDHAERKLRSELHAEAARIDPWRDLDWPDDCTPGQRCKVTFDNDADRGEHHFCDNHQPRGRHHPPPLRYSPIPPSVHTITDLKDWR